MCVWREQDAGGSSRRAALYADPLLGDLALRPASQHYAAYLGDSPPLQRLATFPSTPAGPCGLHLAALAASQRCARPPASLPSSDPPPPPPPPPQPLHPRRSLGCHRVINYKTESLKAVLKAEFPKGVDVVYESGAKGRQQHPGDWGWGAHGGQVQLSDSAERAPLPALALLRDPPTCSRV